MKNIIINIKHIFWIPFYIPVAIVIFYTISETKKNKEVFNVDDFIGYAKTSVSDNLSFINIYCTIFWLSVLYLLH